MAHFFEHHVVALFIIVLCTSMCTSVQQHGLMRGNLLRWIVLMAKISSCSCCETSVFSAGVWIWEPFLPSGPFIWSTPAQIRLLLAQLHLLEGHSESNQSEGKNLMLCNVVSPLCFFLSAGIALGAAGWLLCTLTLMEGDCRVCKGRLQMGRLPLSLAPSLPGPLRHQTSDAH